MAFPSVTGVNGSEEACAKFILNWVSRFEYFKRNPEDLFFTALRDDLRGRHFVAALLRAKKTTKKTVILTGHFDVVDIDVYGALREWAFKPEEYTARLGTQTLPEEARLDLESGKYLFGRGVSDMKTGLAMAMCLFEDYVALGDELDFNVLLLAVPDEEGDSYGMREAATFLTKLQVEQGLDLLTCIDLEPVFNNGSPSLYHGTIGMSTMLFICVGRESHVGEYHRGLNSTLVASYLNISLEGQQETRETYKDQTFPPLCCLHMRDKFDRYSVTLPERSVLYFNCLFVDKPPALIMEEMKVKAMAAMKSALSHVGVDSLKPRVLTVKELIDKAASRVGREKLFSELPPRGMDERDRNIEFILRVLDVADELGPFVVVGFVPPFYPPSINRSKSRQELAVRHAAAQVSENLKSRGFDFKEIEVFQGITDMSYTGFQGNVLELDVLEDNMPLWKRGYDLPVADLRTIDIPSVIFGPLGKDAHRFTERVEIDYSFNVLPNVLKDFISAIVRDPVNSET